MIKPTVARQTDGGHNCYDFWRPHGMHITDFYEAYENIVDWLKLNVSKEPPAQSNRWEASYNGSVFVVFVRNPEDEVMFKLVWG